MKSYLLDTSVIIDYLRGKNQTIELLDKIDGEFCSSYICLAELYEGVYRVKNRRQVGEVVNKFFKSLSGVFGVDWEIAQKFGEIRAELKREGRVIEDIDIFIATTCLVNDLTIITNNAKHFSHVKKLKIYKADE